MRMLRHNKKRNTAFLYEVLVREVVKQSISKNIKKRNKAVLMLKAAFGKNTTLGKELRLFKNLLETKGIPPRAAEKLIQETKKEYLTFDTKKIFEAQSALIKKINKEISKNVFSNFVPNYRNLATISQILGTDVNIKNRVILEENLLNKIARPALTKQSKKTNKISNLVVSGFIKKFNDKYGLTLLENQKTLLNKFILSFLDNGTDFKVFLNEEIENLKKKIRESFELKDLKEDDVMSEKMKKVLDLLENCNTKPIDSEFLQQLLKIQVLAEEVND